MQLARGILYVPGTDLMAAHSVIATTIIVVLRCLSYKSLMDILGALIRQEGILGLGMPMQMPSLARRCGMRSDSR
jgi:hypothetical protein